MIDNTDLSASFLDGWTGAGMFRPQVWHYGFFIRNSLDDSGRILRGVDARIGMESGAIRPQLIANESHLLGIHPGLLDWVAANYQQVSGRRLWNRKPADNEGVASDAIDTSGR